MAKLVGGGAGGREVGRYGGVLSLPESPVPYPLTLPVPLISDLTGVPLRRLSLSSETSNR